MADAQSLAEHCSVPWALVLYITGQTVGVASQGQVK